MTRKDYQAFAEMFKGFVGNVADPDLFLLRLVIGKTADIFAADNPRFDRPRFYTACGIQGYK